MGISAGEVATASDVRKLAPICENQTFTRLLSAASGDVAYTGYGFRPKALIAEAFVSVTPARTWANYGSFASTHSSILHSVNSSNEPRVLEFSSSLLFNLHEENNPSVGQFASVKSLDADGFTLTWNTAAGLTATVQLAILAIGDLQ